MATNWSLGSGFGGGLGGLGRGQGGTGSGLGSSVGSGMGGWQHHGKSSNSAPYDNVPTPQEVEFARGQQPRTPDRQSYIPPTYGKEYVPNPPRQGDQWWNSGVPNPSGYADPYGMEAAGQAGLESRSLGDLLASQYGAAYDGSLFDRETLTARAGITDRARGLDRAGLVSNAGFDRQRLGLRLQDLGLDRQGNALKLEGLGVDRRENESERGYITRLRELAGQGNTNASNRISFEGQDKARSIKSNYITGGTTFSPGHTYDQRANYLRTLSDLESQDIGYNKELAGFDRRDAGLNFADERIGLSEREVGLANQRLDLMAGQLGIDRAQLEDGLNRGLAELGLQGEIDALELLSALSKNTGEQASIIAQLASDAIALGLNPGDLMQGFNGNQLPIFSG